MAFPSFVAEAAIAVVEAAAGEIGAPGADLGARASTLVFDPQALGLALEQALTAVTDIARLEVLAFGGLATYPAVSGQTLNRQRQRDNQAAIVELLRSIATVRYAQEVGIEEYRDRADAVVNRDTVGDALDERAAVADTTAYRSLGALRAAVVDHIIAELRRLPPVIVATPATVQPSIVLAYDIYEDVDRAAEIVGRIALPRPGFVPANPIALPSE